MQKKLSASRGFTLIELLVVIAIIGILSAVVLASLNTARQKGSDAAAQTDIGSVRTEAAIYYSNNNAYYGTGGAAYTAKSVTPASPLTYSSTGVDMFTFDNTIVNAMNQAAKDGAGTVYYAIGQNGSTYAVAVELNSSATNNWYCVDANGTGALISTTQVASGAGLGGGLSADATCP
ncbi:MAG: hypothetical protein B7X04_01740 [Parcubacteria group bacterium 21-54-25]|nr:MAG: hypothetical protein B7X04_01740 [Parcubacteria group bacterium 21-54-25]HQU07702.1 type II secretion system protein [Candidatus Paceibacterota bacterium]